MQSKLGRTVTDVFVCFGLLVGLYDWGGAEARAAEKTGARKAASSFVNEVRAFGVPPPAWKGAVVGDVKALNTPAGLWHLCYLAAGERQSGYILLYEKDGVHLPAMYSGVEPSLGIIEQLGKPTKPAPAPQLRDTHIAQDLLMIASMPRTTENQAVTISSTAAAAASLMAYLHTVRGYPLFDFVAAVNPRTFGLFARPRPVGGDFSGVSEDEARKLRDAGEATWRSYLRELDKTMKDNGLNKSIGGASRPDRAEQIKELSREFEVTASLRRNLLLSSITPDARAKLIRDEQMRAGSALGDVEPTAGRCAARLFEGGYLVSERELGKAMETFMRSRGFQVTCSRKAAGEVVDQDLPALVASTAGDTLALVGSTRMENHAVWSAVVIPDTVKPVRMTWGEHSQKIRAAAALRPPHDRRLPASQPSTSQPARSQREIALDNVIVSTDPVVFLPDSLDRGIHFVVTDCLPGSQWHAIVMSTPVLNDRWGGARPAFARQEYQHD